MTIFNPHTAHLRSRRFLHTVRSDPALTLPAIASLTELWRSDSGLLVSAWTGAKAGTVLAASGTPTIAPGVLNGRSVLRCSVADLSKFTGLATPIGVNPSAFSTFILFRRRTATGGGYPFIVSDAGAAAGGIYTGAYYDSGDDTMSGEVSDSIGMFDYAKASATDGWALLETILDSKSAAPRQLLSSVPMPSFDAGTLPFGPFAFDTMTIGRAFVADAGFDIDIALVGTATTALTVPNRQTLYDWVGAFVGNDPAATGVKDLVAA